tara:strand:+ start:1647 stop:2699 length:1053 start_codon:yes stop_codon:yes gene_type:complete
MAAIYTGGSASVTYGYEAAGNFTAGGLGVAASAITNIFGINQKVSSLTLNTGQMPLNKLGQVEVSKFAYGQQTGSVNIGFVWDSSKSDKIFKAIFGAPSTSSNVDTYPASSTKPFGASSGGVAVSPSSPLSITTRIHQIIANGSNTLLNRTLKGCIVQSLGLSTSIGETLNATLDMAFAREDSTSVEASSGFVSQTNTSPANDLATTPYTFAHGVLQTSTGGDAIATIGEVQDIDITLTTNAELLWGLGSHHASTVFRKIFDVTGRFKTSSKNGDLIQAVIDQSRVGTEEINTADVSLDLTFTDGTKSLKIELGGISITDHSVSGIEPAEPIFEEVNIKAKSVRIVSDQA